jgi:hypothetical protein
MRLFALVVLLSFASIQQQTDPHVRPKEPGIQERNTETKTDSKQQEVNGHLSVTIQKCDHCTIIEKCVGCSDVEKPYAQCQQPDAYNARHDTLYRVYLWFTIIGVLVALGGVLAIYRQTNATTKAAEATQVSAAAALRSAKATERNVKLQENTQRQWLNLEEWHVYRLQPNRPLEIAFQIANNTSLPLTLHDVITTVNGNQVESERAPITMISPDNPFMHSIPVPLNKEQEELYARDALHLNILCTVLFADSNAIHWEQRFGKQLLCSHTKSVVTDTENTLRESGLSGERGSRDVELP